MIELPIAVWLFSNDIVFRHGILQSEASPSESVRQRCFRPWRLCGFARDGEKSFHAKAQRRKERISEKRSKFRENTGHVGFSAGQIMVLRTVQVFPIARLSFGQPVDRVF